jgi:hypothetical protein
MITLPEREEAPDPEPPVSRRRSRWRLWLSGLPASREWRLGAVTAVATQLVLLFWWLGFYPGTLSYDSVAYVWQVSTGNWTTQHSTVYNGLIWLSLRATGQLGLVTLAQTVALAGGLAYAVVGLRRLGAPGKWLAVAAVAATMLPAIGTFAVYVSKDVPFAVTEVWLLGTVARIVAARPAAPGRRVWLALLAEFVLLGLFRQNGFVVIGLTALVLVVVLAGVRWRIIACAGIAIVVGFAANLVVFPALGVRPAGPELVWGPAYADIAVAYADRPNDFTPADKAVMSAVAPLSYWQRTANCYNADDTVTNGNPQFNMAAARAHSAELADLWLGLVKRMPDEIASARVCRGSIAWNPFPGPSRGRTVKIPIDGVQNLFNFPRDRLAASPYADAIRLAPVSGAAHDVGRWLRRLTDVRQFEWIAWRGATWSFLAYVALILFARRRRDLAVLGLGAVILANQVNVMVNNPGQLVRYLAGPLILGILLLPLMFAHPRPRPGPAEALRPDGNHY